jgi:hypothetical protein
LLFLVTTNALTTICEEIEEHVIKAGQKVEKGLKIS